MANYTPQELLEFWQKGKTLNEAINTFADQKSIPEFMHTPMREIKPDENVLIGSLVSGLETLSQFSIQQGKLLENLYEQLNRGDLIAIGHELPMKSSDPLVMIPASMWPPEKCHTGKSTILSNGINFASVRIIAKTNLPKLVASQKLIEPIITPLTKLAIKDKPVGRPTHRHKIIAAYQLLKKNNQIDYSMFLKSHTEIIQKTVMHLFPEIKTIKGMDHEAIRRILMPLFKEDKKTSKLTSKL